SVNLLGGGTDEVVRDLIDINGDGLPDRLLRQGSELLAALNLGYRFADPMVWARDPASDDGTARIATINKASSSSAPIDPSLSYNDGIYGFSAGASLIKNDSRVEHSLVDINGDGLPDLVRPQGDHLSVAFNKGNGFADPIRWNGAPTIAKSRNSGFGVGTY